MLAMLTLRGAFIYPLSVCFLYNLEKEYSENLFCLPLKMIPTIFNLMRSIYSIKRVWLSFYCEHLHS